MPLNVRHLRLVQQIAHEGTVTAAAGALHLTQSAVSHQLKKLEDRLGTPVFERSGRRMVLTPAGARILETADQILDALRVLDEDLEAIAEGRRGTIRLTASCYTCYHWLPEVLPGFRDRYPDVDIVLEPEHSRRALSALAEGEVDLVLTYDPPGEDASFDALPLFTDEQVLVVAPGHRLAERVFVTAEDLGGEHLLLHYGPYEESPLVRSLLRPVGVRPKRVSEVRLTEGILGLVAAGAGVAMVTRWTAAPEVAAGRVVPLRIGELGLHREWKAVRRADDQAPDYLDEFRSRLRGGPARLLAGPLRVSARREARVALPVSSSAPEAVPR